MAPAKISLGNERASALRECFIFRLCPMPVTAREFWPRSIEVDSILLGFGCKLHTRKLTCCGRREAAMDTEKSGAHGRYLCHPPVYFSSIHTHMHMVGRGRRDTKCISGAGQHTISFFAPRSAGEFCPRYIK